MSPLRKLRDLPAHQSCRHPEHDPPQHAALDDGLYEYECPACGYKQRFTIRRGSRWSIDVSLP